MSDAPAPLAFVVPVALDGARLDVVLARERPGLSRTRLQALVREGRVRVDGVVVARPSERVTAGARLELDPPAAARAPAAAGELLRVLHEDEALVVVDKPAGTLTHPGAGDPDGTSISELAVARYGPLPEVQGTDRPGIVHRLDRNTSGVLVLGRTEPALENLKRQFAARTVEKTYLALVQGEPRFDSEWIETPIERAEGGRFRVATEGGGRAAATYIELAQAFDGFALLRCRPRTGRTHQIRVHLASVGLPILGDTRYRPRGSSLRLPEGAPALGRQALHALSIALRHPESGEPVTFEAPLAADFAALAAWLEAERPAPR